MIGDESRDSGSEWFIILVIIAIFAYLVTQVREVTIAKIPQSPIIRPAEPDSKPLKRKRRLFDVQGQELQDASRSETSE
jgi:hypothetical protein